MRKTVVGLVVVAVIGCIAMMRERSQAVEPFTVQRKDTPKPDKKTVKELMTKKLEISQKLLGALVMNDFEKAAKYAEDLQSVRKQAAFMIVKTAQYEIWAKEFGSSADKIIKAATEKNGDAAKLSYLEMTMTCFNCHAYVRDLGDIQLTLPTMQTE